MGLSELGYEIFVLIQCLASHPLNMLQSQTDLNILLFPTKLYKSSVKKNTKNNIICKQNKNLKVIQIINLSNSTLANINLIDHVKSV